MKWENLKKLFQSSDSSGKSSKVLIPKFCPKCSEKYSSSDGFFEKTDEVVSRLEKTKSGIPVKVVIKSRCRTCGYLFDLDIDKRRDNSNEGCYVRNKFEDILEMLIAEGMSREDARKEMLTLFDIQQKDHSKKK